MRWRLKRAGVGLPQVFISYARPDKKRIAKLVTALRGAGFDTWWDDDIPAGAGWEQTIEKALDEAEAVIVGWSPTSVASENVRSEARVARTRGRLVQIFLEPCEPPLFFGERQGIDLSAWRGSDRDLAFQRLQEALRTTISSGPFIPVRAPRNSMVKPVMLTAVAILIAISALAGWWWTHTTAEPAAAVSVPQTAVIETTRNEDTQAAGTIHKPIIKKPVIVRPRLQQDRSQPREDDPTSPPPPPAPPPKTQTE